MKQRVQELIQQGDALFSKRTRVLNMWQMIADQLYLERADFIRELTIDEETDGMMTGAPMMARRDLADALSSMLRPRSSVWFHARTLSENVNEEPKNKTFLDWLSDSMYRIMYDGRAQFIRSTKLGDNDFATFGQCVIETSPNKYLDGLLYRNWHLRDVAWCENEELKIDTVHRNWKPELRNLQRQFPSTVSQNLVARIRDKPYDTVKCRHIVLPADAYDLTAVNGQRLRKMPFVSIYIDTENETILEECYCPRLRYVIPRWATVSGSAYAHSPGAVIAYRDARLLQAMTLTLIEAGEKVVDPPAVATQEGVQGAVNLYAGGVTWVDSEYDERLGDALRYLPIDARALNFGIEREKMVLDAISKALYLDRISVPYPEGDMTATEYRGRVEEYIRRALPLFEPMEVEYNGALCEETFGCLLDMNAFGPLADIMPQELRGADIKWVFDSPLQSATERSKSQAFVETSNLLKMAVEIDPGARFSLDMNQAFRDAIAGTGAPADWIVPQDEADQAREADQQQQAALAQQQQAAQAIALQDQAGQAAQSIGAGRQAMDMASAA